MTNDKIWKEVPGELEHLHKPDILIFKTIPLLHYCALNYHINSTKRKSSIALASVSYVI